MRLTQASVRAQRLGLALCLWAAAASLPSPASAALPKSCPKLSLLFVGNSLFGTQDTGSIVKELLQSAGCKVDTAETVWVASHTLAGHARDLRQWGTPLNKALGSGRHWTHVILQDQSRVPALLFSSDFQASCQGLRVLADAATAAGAKVVLFSTWGYKGPAFNSMQSLLDNGYRIYQRESAPSALIAPAGAAYQDVLKAANWDLNSPSFTSLYADERHPTPQGAFLGAAVVADTIIGRCLPATSAVRPPAPRLGLSADRAAFLLKAACEASTHSGSGRGSRRR